MLADYAIGVIGFVAVAVAWVAVQIAWKRVFPGRGPDPDALAGRGSCHGCKKKGDIPLLSSIPKGQWKN